MKKTIALLMCCALLLSVMLTISLPVYAAEFKIDFETNCTALYLENIDTETVD